MPRLPTKNYIRTHDRLRKLRLRDPALFAELSPTEQWQLHDFFKSDKDWSDLELLQHRQTDRACHTKPDVFWLGAAGVGEARGTHQGSAPGQTSAPSGATPHREATSSPGDRCPEAGPSIHLARTGPGEEEARRPGGSRSRSTVKVPHLDTTASQVVVNRSGHEAQDLSNGCERQPGLV
jgi:hypothetical protein